MIIRNMSISNEFIHYKQASIELNEPGIYLLLGPNGAGKTTLLESIVFDSFDVTFPKPEMERDYHSQRYRLFAYVQQNIEDCDMSVKNYILKDNPVADWGYAKELLRELGFEQDNLEAKVQTLSGGERIKIAFASAIVKNTPYVFLDEPTNYLDDTSVRYMIRILQKRAKDTVVVIASHDERLLDLDATRYHLDGKTIKLEKKKNTTVSELRDPFHFKKPPFRRIACFRINQPINYFIWVLTLVVAFCIAFFLQFSYFTNYDNESVPPLNIIAVYSADMAFDTLNQKYCANADIEIGDASKHKMIYINDIPEIASKKGCADIYIQDSSKYTEFMYQLTQQSMKDQIATDGLSAFDMGLNCFALPEIIYQDERFLGILGMTDFCYLTEGRLPKDDAKEISISRRLLQKYFNFNESESQNAVGKTLMYNDEQYLIVGIQYIDVCIISYSNSLEDCGLYRYDPATFSKFVIQYNAYIEENELINKNVETLVVLTKPGTEKNILNKLIEEYPANNYFSSVFAETWIRENNGAFTKTIWVVTLFSSLVLGICFLFIQYQQTVLNISRLNEYNRYYLDRKKISLSYCTLNTTCCSVIVCVDVVFIMLINSIFGMLRYVITLNVLSVLLLLLPSLILLWVRVLRIDLKTNNNFRQKM